MDYYSNNRVFFHDKYQVDIHNDTRYSYEVTVSREENFPVLSFNDGDSIRHLNSSYSLIKEAERWVAHVEYADLFVVIGTGPAIHLKLLREKYPAALITVIEPETGFLDILCHHYDIASMLSLPGIVFLKNESDLALYAPGGIITHINCLVSPGYASVFSNATKSTQRHINHRISQIHSDWLTQKSLAIQWYRNSVRNMTNIKHSILKCLAGNFEKTIVAGAGPGLEKAIEKIDKKTFIIATDTAADYFFQSGISPHIIISIDGRNISRLNFMSVNDSSQYILDIVFPSFIARRIKNTFFVTSHFPFSAYFCAEDGLLPFYDSSSGNVGSASLFFASLLHAREILVFGLDFCYPRGKTYARGTYIHSHFLFSENRLKTYLSREWDFMSSYSLEYDYNVKTYTTPLLDMYKKANSRLLLSLGYTPGREKNHFVLQTDTSNKYSDLKNVPLWDIAYCSYLGKLKHLSTRAYQPVDFFLLPDEDRRLMLSIAPLMLVCSGMRFSERLKKASALVEKIISEIQDSTITDKRV